jgi:hypothetical protein
MKKLTLTMITVLTLLTLNSCRVTKTMAMLTAKKRATTTESNFLSGKHLAVDFLGFSKQQNDAVEIIWKTEKKEFSEVKLENENIAPIIYKSENDFRKILTTDQLEKYKKASDKFDSRLTDYFLDDDSLAELKRIYNL